MSKKFEKIFKNFFTSFTTNERKIMKNRHRLLRKCNFSHFSHLIKPGLRFFPNMPLSPKVAPTNLLTSCRKPETFIVWFPRKNWKCVKKGGFPPFLTPQNFFSKIGLSGAHSFILALLRAKNLRIPTGRSTLTGWGRTTDGLRTDYGLFFWWSAQGRDPENCNVP